ncbi:MAG: hypothetical protein ACHREM_08845 [Polyangiales bacterium]
MRWLDARVSRELDEARRDLALDVPLVVRIVARPADKLAWFHDRDERREVTPMPGKQGIAVGSDSVPYAHPFTASQNDMSLIGDAFVFFFGAFSSYYSWRELVLVSRLPL